MSIEDIVDINSVELGYGRLTDTKMLVEVEGRILADETGLMPIAFHNLLEERLFEVLNHFEEYLRNAEDCSVSHRRISGSLFDVSAYSTEVTCGRASYSVNLSCKYVEEKKEVVPIFTIRIPKNMLLGSIKQRDDAVREHNDSLIEYAKLLNPAVSVPEDV